MVDRSRGGYGWRTLRMSTYTTRSCTPPHSHPHAPPRGHPHPPSGHPPPPFSGHSLLPPPSATALLNDHRTSKAKPEFCHRASERTVRRSSHVHAYTDGCSPRHTRTTPTPSPSRYPSSSPSPHATSSAPSQTAGSVSRPSCRFPSPTSSCHPLHPPTPSYSTCARYQSRQLPSPHGKASSASLTSTRFRHRYHPDPL